MLTDTDEQRAIIEKAKTRRSFRVIARAGTGKTTTAKRIVEESPDCRFLYLAFNKRNADEAERKFQLPNVTICTAHKLAMRAVGFPFRDRLTTSLYQLRTGLWERFTRAYEQSGGDPERVGICFYGVLETINNFTASASTKISVKEHVPEGPYDQELIAKLARGIWRKMIDPNESVPITHDVYLKLAQLRGIAINADMILFDESQDASPAMLDIVLRSRKPTAFLGDPCQAIYGFRGAVDAFEHVKDLPTLTLTASWRFGPEIAAIANQILRALGETVLVKGNGGPGQVIADGKRHYDAIIARSNTGLMGEAIRLLDSRAKIHIVGGHEPVVSGLRAAYELRYKGATQHPLFAGFGSWNELVVTSEQAIGKSFKPFVRCLDEYGKNLPSHLDRLERSCVSSSQANVILTTPHRYKGDEADNVLFANDYSHFCKREEIGDEPFTSYFYTFDREEAHLAYVTATRARKVLDIVHYQRTLNESISNLTAYRASQSKRAELLAAS